MKGTHVLASIAGTAMTAVLLVAGAGSAQAADDGSLLSLLDVPSVTLVCFPTGQAGANNTFTGTQNINCSQSAQSASGGSGSGGFTGYEVVTDTVECPVDATCSITLTCPTGKKVTGGGVYAEPDAPGVQVVKSGALPGSDNTRWDAGIFNGSTDSVVLTVQAFCADVDG
ncbi:hypothetical protein [Streptomyces sp. NPDC054787]